jgi:hypothetical protein
MVRNVISSNLRGAGRSLNRLGLGGLDILINSIVCPLVETLRTDWDVRFTLVGEVAASAGGLFSTGCSVDAACRAGATASGADGVDGRLAPIVACSPSFAAIESVLGCSTSGRPSEPAGWRGACLGLALMTTFNGSGAASQVNAP